MAFTNFPQLVKNFMRQAIDKLVFLGFTAHPTDVDAPATGGRAYVNGTRLKFITANGARWVLLSKAATLPNYADNAAAVSGGLVSGDFYQTSGTVKVVV